MADYYALTGTPLPTALHGSDADFAIRALSERERLAIEDYFFRKNIKLVLSPLATAVVVPQTQTANATMDDLGVLVEFALAVLSVSGFVPVTIVAMLNASACTEAAQRSFSENTDTATFAKKVVKSAASAWVRRFFAARRNSKDRLHITADRFVRYSKQIASPDAMVDLCICLESLIDSQSEISFRFATTLAKVTASRNAQEISEWLHDLYELRCKVVHGTDSSKAHRKVAPNAANLRHAARSILTTYVLFLSEHTKDEWKTHMSNSLFA